MKKDQKLTILSYSKENNPHQVFLIKILANISTFLITRKIKNRYNNLRNILSFLQSDTGDGKSTLAYSILNFCHGVDLKKVNVTQLNVKWKLDVKVMATAAHLTHSLKLLNIARMGNII